MCGIIMVPADEHSIREHTAQNREKHAEKSDHVWAMARAYNPTQMRKCGIIHNNRKRRRRRKNNRITWNIAIATSGC